MGFAYFYLILVMQIFMDFQNFANFCLVSCKVLKAVKIEFDIMYLSWGSPQASFRLTTAGWD